MLMIRTPVQTVSAGRAYTDESLFISPRHLVKLENSLKAVQQQSFSYEQAIR
jgi:hypothetical protein